MKHLCAGLVCGVLMLASGAAHAQPDAAMRDGLIVLSRTLGSVHYLRPLCRPEEGQTWRNKMMSLLADKSLTVGVRDSMIAAFNEGYVRQQQAHKACTPSAANLGNTYARQGAAQAASLARRQ